MHIALQPKDRGCTQEYAALSLQVRSGTLISCKQNDWTQGSASRGNHGRPNVTAAVMASPVNCNTTATYAHLPQFRGPSLLQVLSWYRKELNPLHLREDWKKKEGTPIWTLSLCLLTRCYLCSVGSHAVTSPGQRVDFVLFWSARIIDCAVPTGSWSCSCRHIWGWNTNSRSGLISLQDIQSVQKLIIKVDIHCLYVRCWQSILKFFLIHIKWVFQLVPVCDYSHLHVLHTKTRMTLSGHPSFFAMFKFDHVLA